jgi:diaminopimelate dehydrogenase
VIPVESLAALEEEGQGVPLERWGAAAGRAHQRLLVEARCDALALAAQVMLAAARAVGDLGAGAHALVDVPVARLFGIGSAAAREAAP